MKILKIAKIHLGHIRKNDCDAPSSSSSKTDWL